MSDVPVMSNGIPRGRAASAALSGVGSTLTTLRAVIRTGMVACAFVLIGCGAPSSVNIALRKQVQTQQAEIDRLSRQHAADVASLKVAATTGPSSRPSLSPAITETLFTTHDIKLGQLTKQTADGLVVHVVPLDDAAEPLKAAGTFEIDAYDLADGGKSTGHWTFDAATTRTFWNGSALRYEYVVPCRWTSPTPKREMTVKVTFVDALTGRSFSQQSVLPPSAE